MFDKPVTHLQLYRFRNPRSYTQKSKRAAPYQVVIIFTNLISINIMNGLAENQETLVISDENPLSEYEQQRLNRIEENNKTLLKLVSF